MCDKAGGQIGAKGKFCIRKKSLVSFVISGVNGYHVFGRAKRKSINVGSKEQHK